MQAAPTPDLEAFAAAQARKLQTLGSDVTFLTAPVRTWPDGTGINPETGDPYNVTVEPLTVERDQFVVRCAVFFKAINRGGAANAAIASPGGYDERTRIFVIAPYNRLDDLKRAVEFIFHENTWQISTVKVDQVLGEYKRVLVYGAEE